MKTNLFNEKTISKNIIRIEPTSKQITASKKWIELLEKDELQDEVANYPRFTELILNQLLGYDTLNFKHEEKNMEFPFRDKSGNFFVCFEAKGTKTKDLWKPQGRNFELRKTPVIQLNSYMYDWKIPYGVLTNYREFVLFKREEGSQKFHKIDFLDIKKNTDKLKEFIAIFSRESFEKEDTNKLYNDSIVEERNLTKGFYKLYHETRLMILKEFKESGLDNETCLHYAQLFLNRLMFIFFAEDTELLDKRYFESRILEVLEKGGGIDVYTDYIFGKIKSTFRELDKEIPKQIKGFNGELFKEEIDGRLSFKDYRNKSFFKDVFQDYKLDKELQLKEHDRGIFNKHKNRLSKIIENILLMASFDFKSEVNVNILGHIFEQSIQDIENLKEEKISKRKQEGIFYTPEYVTDYICRNTIIPYLSKSGTNDINELIDEHSKDIQELEKKFKSIKILDPACGSGAFLIKSTEILFEIFEKIQFVKDNYGEYEASRGLKRKSNFKGQLTFKKWDEKEEIKNIIENNIYGVDINEESVEITKLSLFLKIARKNKKLIDLSNNIKRGNSLVDDKSIDEKAFNWKKEFPFKFDVVIGNPPYVRVQELQHKHTDYFKKKYKFAHKRIDISLLFFERGLNLLSENGMLSFISSNQFLSTAYGEKARESLLNKGIKKIIDFGDLPVFEDALTYTSIFVIDHKKSEQFNYSKINSIEDFITTKYSIAKINIKDLGKDKWVLGENKIKEVLKKIENNSKKLNEDNLVESHYGIISGKDEILILDEEKLKNMNFENRFIKKIIMPQHINKWLLESVDENIIYPYEYIDEKTKILSESQLKSSAKNIYEYLKSNKKELESRKDSRKTFENRKDWFGLVRFSNIFIFNKEKIVSPTIVKSNKFSLDTNKYSFAGGKTVVLTSEKLDLKYLLCILNSKIAQFYYHQICPVKSGGYYNYSATFILEFPIKKLSLEQQKPFIEKADFIIDKNRQFYEAKMKFIKLIKYKYNLDKISRKLDTFYNLSFKEFVNEIQDKNNLMSIEKESELMDFFEKNKKEINSLLNDISKTESEINNIVYDLYGLTKEEKEIVEESLR